MLLFLCGFVGRKPTTKKVEIICHCPIIIRTDEAHIRFEGKKRKGRLQSSNLGFSLPFVPRMSSEKSNSSAVSGRSKPRLVKIRRQMGSQQGKSSNNSGLNPFQSVFENSNQVNNATSSSSNGFNSLVGDVGFVFGSHKNSLMSNLNSEKEQCTGSAEGFGSFNNVGFVFGVNKSNSDSNSHSEHKESSGGVGELGANVGFVFGANKSSSLTNLDLERRPSSGNVQQLGADEFGELNYGGFVFGAKKSNSDSNSHSEHKESSGGVGELGANVGFVFGANKSSSLTNSDLKGDHPVEMCNSWVLMSLGNSIMGHKESSGGVGELGADVGFVFGANKNSSLTNSDLERRPSSGNVQQLGADEFGELNYGGFVFGAKKSNSDSNSHSEHKESSGGVGELGADVGFVFGANKNSSLTNSDLERRPSSGNVQQLGADEFGELNYGGFVFGDKKSNSDSNSHSEHKESSGGVGELGADVGFVFGANKSSSLTNSDLERRPSSGNVQQLGADEFGELNYGGFVFGAKKSNSDSNSHSEHKDLENMKKKNSEKYEEEGIYFSGSRQLAKDREGCGLFLSEGLIGFIFTRNPTTLRTDALFGAALLSLITLSLKYKEVIAVALLWKNFQTYSMTKKLFPTGFYAAISAAMQCFYSYVVLSGGNPPPKKLKSSAVAPS
ncbi:unnamed protein product [Camellia sinensis]